MIKTRSMLLFLVLTAGCVQPEVSKIHIDAYLANMNTDVNAERPPAIALLSQNGVSEELIEGLVALMIKSHSRPDTPAYHTLDHSARVANVIALMLQREPEPVPANYKV